MQLNSNLIVNENFRHDILHLFKNQFGTVLNILDYLQLAKLSDEELEQLSTAKHHTISLHKSLQKLFDILTAVEIIDSNLITFEIIPLQQAIVTGYFRLEGLELSREILFQCNYKKLLESLHSLKELCTLLNLPEATYTISVDNNNLCINAISDWTTINLSEMLNSQPSNNNDVRVQIYVYDFYLKAMLSGAKIVLEDDHLFMLYSIA